MNSYHEEGTYEEHQKRIGKLRRLWWKISQMLGSEIHRFCEGHQTHKLIRLHNSEDP